MKIAARVFMISATLVLAACSTDPCDDSVMAMAAGDLVKGATKNPRTAKVRDVVVTKISYCRYRATGTVEATNSLGAMLEQPFELVVSWTGTEYRGTGIQIGDDPSR